MVAFSSAGFFSSITASGSPLTNSTTSGRRVCWPFGHGELVDGQPVVVVRARRSRSPAPARRRWSHRRGGTPPSTPSTSIRCRARLRSIRDGASARVSLRKASSSASGGSSGLSRDERLPQASLQHHVAVVRVAALGRRLPRRDLRAVQDRVAQRLQPGEGGVFDDGFGEGACSRRLPQSADRHGMQALAEARAALAVVEHDAGGEASAGGLPSLRRPRKSAAVTVADAFTSTPATSLAPRSSTMSTSAPSLSRKW